MWKISAHFFENNAHRHMSSNKKIKTRLYEWPCLLLFCLFVNDGADANNSLRIKYHNPVCVFHADVGVDGGIKIFFLTPVNVPFDGGTTLSRTVSNVITRDSTDASARTSLLNIVACLFCLRIYCPICSSATPAIGAAIK